MAVTNKYKQLMFVEPYELDFNKSEKREEEKGERGEGVQETNIHYKEINEQEEFSQLTVEDIEIGGARHA